MTFLQQLMGWASRMATDSNTQFMFWLFLIAMLMLAGLSIANG